VCVTNSIVIVVRIKVDSAGEYARYVLCVLAVGVIPCVVRVDA